MQYQDNVGMQDDDDEISSNSSSSSSAAAAAAATAAAAAAAAAAVSAASNAAALGGGALGTAVGPLRVSRLSVLTSHQAHHLVAQGDNDDDDDQRPGDILVDRRGRGSSSSRGGGGSGSGVGDGDGDDSLDVGLDGDEGDEEGEAAVRQRRRRLRMALAGDDAEEERHGGVVHGDADEHELGSFETMGAAIGDFSPQFKFSFTDDVHLDLGCGLKVCPFLFFVCGGTISVHVRLVGGGLEGVRYSDGVCMADGVFLALGRRIAYQGEGMGRVVACTAGCGIKPGKRTGVRTPRNVRRFALIPERRHPLLISTVALVAESNPMNERVCEHRERRGVA